VPEGDNAAEIGGVLGRAHIVEIHDTEGYLTVAAEGIDLMSFHGGMEKEGPVSIDIAEGDGIGIAVVAADGKDAMGATGEDIEGFALGELLSDATHGTEILHGVRGVFVSY